MAGLRSWRSRCKIDGVLTHKLIEALESAVSFYVTSDTILVAGNIAGYDQLEGRVSVLRWGSFASSCILLPLAGLDFAKRPVFLNGLRHAHLLPHIRHKLGMLSAVLFQASEVLGHLVWVPCTFAMRPASLLPALAFGCFICLSLAGMYVLRVMQVFSERGWKLNVRSTVIAGSFTTPLFAVFNLLGASDFSSLRAPSCPSNPR